MFKFGLAGNQGANIAAKAAPCIGLWRRPSWPVTAERGLRGTIRFVLSRGDPRPRISLAGRKRVAIALSATVRIENAIEQHLAGLLKLIRWVAGIGVALLILYLAFRFLGLMH